MKFTLDWLKEHLDTNASLDEITEALTRVGLEVEEVINPGANLKGFVTAEIVKKEKHPDADKLNLLTVSNGKESFQVVCGAPNCYEGLKGIFAAAGTIIPQYNEELKVGKIRGIESFGMMCSEKELCIGDDHSGIIELHKDTSVGIPAAEALAFDPVIEIAITPNRADCLGVRGIARDLAAVGLGTLKKLRIDCPKLFDKVTISENVVANKSRIATAYASPIALKVEDSEACPIYVGRYIKAVDNKAKTPSWIKSRLNAIGIKSISPVVDITNYINYDLARPLHAFDADKLKGDVVIRMAKDGEKFVSLEDKEYALDGLSLGVCDDDGVQCLGGIMGGISKGCSADTSNIFLESALFKPEVISRTGRKFQIDSDSRYRYERWVDPTSNVMASDYAAALIAQYCGGEISDIVICGQDKWDEKLVYTSAQKIKDFVGIEVGEDKIVEILNHLGFQASANEGQIKAVVPSWRGDVSIENDLIEEVVRIIGLDNVPAISLPTAKLPKQTLSYEQKRVVLAKHELASRGMFETVTWSFTDSNIGQYFRKSDDEILLSNPIAADLNEMRQSIIPNLLLGVKNNIARGYNDVSLFEVGPEFFGRRPKEQKMVAAGVRSGKTSKKNWAGDVREYDVFDAKADAVAVIAAANGPSDNAQITNDAPKYYHPGRSGAMRLGKNVLAFFGELHPYVLKKMGVKQRVVAFEVYMENIPTPRGNVSKAKKKLELSQFQPVDKDFAFVIDKTVSAVNVITAVKSADKDNIADVRVFDIYEGANLPDGKKSIAISVTFQPQEKTYSDQELETLMNKVIVAVGQKNGGVIRS